MEFEKDGMYKIPSLMVQIRDYANELAEDVERLNGYIARGLPEPLLTTLCIKREVIMGTASRLRSILRGLGY